MNVSLTVEAVVEENSVIDWDPVFFTVKLRVGV